MQAKREKLITSLGLLVLRVGVGGFLATHGWGKLQMVLAGNFDQFGDPVGLGSGVSLVLMTLAEFFCALLVVAGAATRLAAIPVVIGLLVAAFVVHGGDPWTMAGGYKAYMAGEADSWASKEPALLFVSAFLALVFTGAGRFSVDGIIWPWWRRRRARKKAESG